jgi:hypothetical protein
MSSPASDGLGQQKQLDDANQTVISPPHAPLHRPSRLQFAF